MHNEQLMGIRREEEMEMSDDDMEDAPDSKDSEDSGMYAYACAYWRFSTSVNMTGHPVIRASRGRAPRAPGNRGRQLCLTAMTVIIPRASDNTTGIRNTHTHTQKVQGVDCWVDGVESSRRLLRLRRSSAVRSPAPGV